MLTGHNDGIASKLVGKVLRRFENMVLAGLASAVFLAGPIVLSRRVKFPSYLKALPIAEECPCPLL